MFRLFTVPQALGGPIALFEAIEIGFSNLSQTGQKPLGNGLRLLNPFLKRRIAQLNAAVMSAFSSLEASDSLVIHV